MRLKIVSTGLFAPPIVETAEDLAPRLRRSAAWIVRHTGVARRHRWDGDPAVMAAEAARAALAGSPPPDLVLNASLTPRQLIPDTSVFVCRELGLSGVPAWSIHATCLSFLVALRTAAGLLETGPWRRILIVSAERASPSRDWRQPESAALFGDGAAAAVVELAEPGESSAMLGFAMRTWPEGAELAQIVGAGVVRHPNHPATRPEDHLFQMAGVRIYKMARAKVEILLRELLDGLGLDLSDIDLVVPHQASGNALAALQKYGLPRDRVVDIVGEYGNCIAASMPMALAHAHAQGRLHRGDRVLLIGTGAGLSVAAAVLRW